MRGMRTKAMLIGFTILLSGRSYANEEITVDLPGGVTMEMVAIEPGTFTMGSPDSEPKRIQNEGPQHQVTLTQGFYLGKYELTQAQWQAVMGTAPWSGKPRVQANPNNPAVFISGDDLQVFVDKLNQEAGDSLYRLPTEAEWEYACRAGTTTTWSFGDEASKGNDYAWYSDNAWNAGEQYAHAVGTKLPNPWGLYDMHGNVLEWLQAGGESVTYLSSNQTDPPGSVSGILRGGRWSKDSSEMRSAARNLVAKTNADPYSGARLVRMALATPSAVAPKGWGQLKKDAR